tara:strand:- start:118 stop:330 length:213 start_codon:yes stop_codon:yes gene_type:complete
MKVYVLQHVHEINSDIEDVKFIGVFSSVEQANAAKNRLKNKPGFFDSQDGFSIDEYELDITYWEDGFCTV